MKTQKKTLTRGKQSRIGSSAENIWFYSESSIEEDQPVDNQKKSGRADRQSVVQDQNDRASLDRSWKLSSRKESYFIVDWQMSDNL